MKFLKEMVTLSLIVAVGSCSVKRAKQSTTNQRGTEVVETGV